MQTHILWTNEIEPKLKFASPCIRSKTSSLKIYMEATVSQK